MKIPSLSPIPKYKRFHITPRYYDPVKDEIAQRTSRIKQEMDQRDIEPGNTTFSGAFNRHRREDKQANMLTVLIVLLLTSFFTGYLFYGNNVFYLFLILFPAYIFYRIKVSSRPK